MKFKSPDSLGSHFHDTINPSPCASGCNAKSSQSLIRGFI